jgi:hypothetical protein
MHDDVLDEAARTLSKVRRMFDAAREVLESGPADTRLHANITRLERIVAEVERVEQTCARSVPAAGRRSP